MRTMCETHSPGFDQVEGVSDSDRDLAFANIRAAARFYGVELHEKSWRDLGN